MSESNIDWHSRASSLTIEVRHIVEGRSEPAKGRQQLEKFCPRDGSLLYRFRPSERGEVHAAIASARRAFEDGRWSRASIQHRKNVLSKLAALLQEHKEELALLECMDVGKPISEALNFDVPHAAESIRRSAESIDHIDARVYAVDSTSLSYQLRRPFGVVAAIVGWNFPLVLAAGKVGPALATGNSLVLKPSELTALSAVRLAELAMQAGVPPGVFNVVHGGPDIGVALAHHPDIDLVTFTGSTQTGKKLLVASGESNMKRLILECGGKAPNIVFDDGPDLEQAADAIVARAFWNQGQVCTASSRLLIQRNIKEELLRILLPKVAALRPQDPLNVKARFGAIASGGHLQKILEYVSSGEQEGARLLYRCDNDGPVQGGFYAAPIIFDEVATHQRIAREEIFGPVLSVMSFHDEAEAIRIANDTIYGLSATLWTKDLGRAHRVTQALRTGWVTINATGCPAGGPSAGVVPIGGHKESGVGVEGGIAGLAEYTSHTAVQIFV